MAKITLEAAKAALVKEATALGAAIKTRDSASFNYLRLGIKLNHEGVFKGSTFDGAEYWNTYKIATGWKGTAETEKKNKSNFSRVFDLGQHHLAAYALALADTELKQAEEKLAKKIPGMVPYSRDEQIIRMVPKLKAIAADAKVKTLSAEDLQGIIVRKSGMKSDVDPFEKMDSLLKSIGTLINGGRDKDKNKPEFPSLNRAWNELCQQFEELKSKKVVTLVTKKAAAPTAKRAAKKAA